MTDKLLQELKEYAETGNMYDFIANHYWELSKDELKDLFLEYAYATYSVVRCKHQGEKDFEKINQEFIENYLERIS